MPGNKIASKWIHILLKGEHTTGQTADDTDESNQSYLREFASKSLNAIQVPILEFRYDSHSFRYLIEQANKLQPAARRDSPTTGLILTSPRAVNWVSLAQEANLIKFVTDERNIPSSRQFQVHSDGSRSFTTLEDSYQGPVDTVIVNENLVFVVGPKTAEGCLKNLNVHCYKDSIETGSVAELARVIFKSCEDHPETNLNLFYPKSSLADSTLEQTLSSVPNLNLISFVAYETSCLADLTTPLAAKLSECLIKLEGGDDKHENELRLAAKGQNRYEVNLIFFSPSGVEGFCRSVNLDNLSSSIVAKLSRAPVTTYRFSCIGPTTESALRRHKLDVFHVARKPSAQSLVEGLVTECQVDLAD